MKVVILDAVPGGLAVANKLKALCREICEITIVMRT